MGRKILFITTDMMRWDSLGYYGDPYAQTPNLDKLAAEGIRYDAARNQNPLCMPCRNSLITGQYPRTNGSWNNGIPLPHDTRTIANVLHDVARLVLAEVDVDLLLRGLDRLPRPVLDSQHVLAQPHLPPVTLQRVHLHHELALGRVRPPRGSVGRVLAAGSLLDLLQDPLALGEGTGDPGGKPSRRLLRGLGDLRVMRCWPMDMTASTSTMSR